MTSLLTAAFNAATEVDYLVTPPAPLTPDERLALARRRALVRKQVHGCTACPLRDSGWVRRPVAMDGPLEPKMVVVGEAPGMIENRSGRPFVGPSGQLMRAMLEEAGVDPATVLFLNAVSCFPHGTPNEQSLRACRGNLDAQMDVANCPYVILAGNTALWQWRADLTVTKSNGVVFVRDGRAFMPILHPSYVLRQQWGDERKEVVDALGNMRSIVEGDLGLGWFFGRTCSAPGCGEWLDHYDPEGVPWCERHWGSRVQTWTEVMAAKKVEREKKAMQAKVRVRRRQQGAM